MKTNRKLHKLLIRNVGHSVLRSLTDEFPVLRRVDELDQVYHLPREELLSRQWEKLRKVVKAAYESCPYYTELLDGIGMKPGDIKTPADYARIPFLTKAVIRKRAKDMLARGADTSKLVESGTAGTTDMPITFYRTREVGQEKWAQTASFNRWYGWDVGDPVAFLWGAAMDIYKPMSLRGRVKKFLINQDVLLPTVPLTEQELAHHWKTLERFAPRVIQGYPVPLYLLARHVKEAGGRLDLPDLAAIVATAEPLYDYQRELVEEMFPCKVYDRYGARETGLISQECAAERALHINTEGVYLEIIADGRPAEEGETGEVIVTDLHNTTMPFLRYQLGDVAALSTRACSCGSGLPIMHSITGRVGDLVVLPNGVVVPGFWFPARLVKYVPNAVEQLQVIQEEPLRFTIKYVPGANFSRNDMAKMQEMFVILFGKEPRADWVVVDDIPRDRSGKTRVCISKVSADFLGVKPE
ncbi:MAG: phenylacetate--CoA ligase family protein [Candidatus Eisenbacteria bacterium]|nr:phenylacetate--CoA ligase family protein [Candidatus Eisenbacteria bacterium]